MRMYDLIAKKRDGKALTTEEINYLIDGYVKGEIPDYQMSAFLMAVYFQGMTKEETHAMTMAVAHSGDMVDLSGITGIKVDKHSTGGVGDKITLIIAPMVAAQGVRVAKMSGRGLGHTGGTIDKLESIPGFRTDLNQKEFFETVNKTGLSVIGQSGNMTPADKMMYALRDVTATVESIPLIAVSIMGKKLAAGSDCILLDVKTGSGAFMKSVDDAILLAQEMVEIGERAGKRTEAVITNMDVPLGKNIGNALEVQEAVAILKGEGPKDLHQESVNLAASMLHLAGKGSLEECKVMAEKTLTDGSALSHFADMVKAQGGDETYIQHPENFKDTAFHYEVKAQKSGYITHMNTEEIGISSTLLGAGRETKESIIDPAAGIVIEAKTGDMVKEGDLLATLYANKEELFEASAKRYANAIEIKDEAPSKQHVIFARVTRDGVERFD
ncbi:MAG: pyrimidine-nucleoside phosphorylase [Lachnospiraceae bacterium]|nr:pyrimidine-nucleoside phosphorylase [Lachnospiraceae bacterium]